jgi:hypothetical protein
MTMDQGNNDSADYSRLTDNDPDTFWKSNPYLDHYFTGEENALHPQWIVIDFGANHEASVNAVKVLWGTPHAVTYEIQYCADRSLLSSHFVIPQRRWRTFSMGDVTGGDGSATVRLLSRKPIRARFFKIVMKTSSGRASSGLGDVRDQLGYAVREIELGVLDRAGHFTDAIRHAASREQTATFVSSTDPWHRASDVDLNVEQPGIDAFFSSPLTHGVSVMFPVGLIFDTPENAATLLRYVRRHHYPVNRVELGEEPDGQYIEPEDYGALYAQWARALRQVDPEILLGGPSFQGLLASDFEAGTAGGWIARWLNVLARHHQERDLHFVSFEWYPYFDEICATHGADINQNPRWLEQSFTNLYKDGVPRDVPVFITEYGYSALSAQPEMEMNGALVNADTAGTFAVLGGSASYVYQLLPGDLEKAPDCESWGNNALFVSKHEGEGTFKSALYYADQLVRDVWASPPAEPMDVFRAQVTSWMGFRSGSVSAYALRNSGRHWSVLLTNRRHQGVFVEIVVRDTFTTRDLSGPLEVVQYSGDNYHWQAAGADGHPDHSTAPTHKILTRSEEQRIYLPPMSISVVREPLGDYPRLGKMKGILGLSK